MFLQCTILKWRHKQFNTNLKRKESDMQLINWKFAKFMTFLKLLYSKNILYNINKIFVFYKKESRCNNSPSRQTHKPGCILSLLVSF